MLSIFYTSGGISSYPYWCILLLALCFLLLLELYPCFYYWPSLRNIYWGSTSSMISSSTSWVLLLNLCLSPALYCLFCFRTKHIQLPFSANERLSLSNSNFSKRSMFPSKMLMRSPFPWLSIFKSYASIVTWPALLSSEAEEEFDWDFIIWDFIKLIILTQLNNY